MNQFVDLEPKLGPPAAQGIESEQITPVLLDRNDVRALEFAWKEWNLRPGASLRDGNTERDEQ